MVLLKFVFQKSAMECPQKLKYSYFTLSLCHFCAHKPFWAKFVPFLLQGVQMAGDGIYHIRGSASEGTPNTVCVFVVAYNGADGVHVGLLLLVDIWVCCRVWFAWYHNCPIESCCL